MKQVCITSRDQIEGFEEDVFINCMGLGARNLLTDPEDQAERNLLKGEEGRIALIEKSDGVDYFFSGGVSDSTMYMFARHDDIVVGGTFGRLDNYRFGCDVLKDPDKELASKDESGSSCPTKFTARLPACDEKFGEVLVARMRRLFSEPDLSKVVQWKL